MTIYVDQSVRYKRRKATRGMETSKIAKASSTGKLSVVFDANCRQPICINTERFNNEIGFIVRNHGTFAYKDWRLVLEEVRAPLRSYLLVSFLRPFLYMCLCVFRSQDLYTSSINLIEINWYYLSHVIMIFKAISKLQLIQHYT